MFAVWLWNQALFDIYIPCLHRMVVRTAMIPLFILTTVRNTVHGVIPALANLSRGIAAWIGPIIVLTYRAITVGVLPLPPRLHPTRRRRSFGLSSAFFRPSVPMPLKGRVQSGYRGHTAPGSSRRFRSVHRNRWEVSAGLISGSPEQHEENPSR